ncbi:unnamed protein product, partial [Laminaria digitata]
SGGPEGAESVAMWRIRLQQQQESAPIQREEEQQQQQQQESAPIQRELSEHYYPPPPIDTTTARVVTTPSREEGNADRSFRALVSSSAGLDALATRGNPETLKEVQRVMESFASSFSPIAGLSYVDERREVGRLVKMAANISDLVMKDIRDKDMTRRELALQPFAQAYYNAVTTGLTDANMAASVIGSHLVCTSKTGRMGKAGTAVKQLTGLPIIGAAAAPIAAILKAGDAKLQTHSLKKIRDLAPDVAECCSLARKLGLQLTDGLPNDVAAVPDEVEEARVQAAAGVDCGAGEG